MFNLVKTRKVSVPASPWIALSFGSFFSMSQECPIFFRRLFYNEGEDPKESKKIAKAAKKMDEKWRNSVNGKRGGSKINVFHLVYVLGKGFITEKR